MASSQDAWYLSLLGLAENFRTSSPPNIKLCIQCLQAVFHFKPPPRVEARTHLQLGNILLTHTKNVDLAKTHLEQAVSLVRWKLYYYLYLLVTYHFKVYVCIIAIIHNSHQLFVLHIFLLYHNLTLGLTLS